LLQNSSRRKLTHGHDDDDGGDGHGGEHHGHGD